MHISLKDISTKHRSMGGRILGEAGDYRVVTSEGVVYCAGFDVFVCIL